MQKPKLHGLQSTFELSAQKCRSLKVDCSLSLVTANNWSSPRELAAAYITFHGTAIEVPQDVLKKFVHSFSVISHKCKKHLALSTYCEELRQYMSCKDIRSQFFSHYVDIRLDAIAKKSGYFNAKRLAIIGGQVYGNELERNIEIPKENILPPIDILSSPLSTASSSTIIIPNSSSPSVKKTTTITDHYSLLEKRERDQLYPKSDHETDESDRLSVGTIIKRRALLKHKAFQQGERLSISDKKIMSCGLSSILDLIDLSSSGQGSLFDKYAFDNIKEAMMKKYTVMPRRLSSKMSETWDIISKLCNRENSVELARQYLYKIRSKSPKMIHIMEIVLDILENQTVFFDKNFSSRVTEYDYLLKIWGPLLEAILSINGHLVRLKSGESINSLTSQSKREAHNNNNTCGFKVDLRFVLDGFHDEYDVGAGEMAKNTNMDKMQRDLSKLVREGKDVLDGLLNIALDQDTAKELTAWMVQICGLQGQISSLHLSHNGLYVALPQFKFSFPTSVSALHSFKNSLESLITFVFEMEKSAHIIKSAVQELENKRDSMGKKLNRPRESLPGHELINWTRPTWYSPPQNKPALSTIPLDLFKKPVPDNNDVVTLIEGDNKNDDDEASTLADEFGWYIKEGQWINYLTNACTFSNPYDDDPTE